MSILAALGAVPSNFTVPLTLATVAGSMGVAAAGAAACSAALEAGASSFLLHAASTKSAHNASVMIVQLVFLFMMSPFCGFNLSPG
jgi:hypothetical protein